MRASGLLTRGGVRPFRPSHGVAGPPDLPIARLVPLARTLVAIETKMESLLGPSASVTVRLPKDLIERRLSHSRSRRQAVHRGVFLGAARVVAKCGKALSGGATRRPAGPARLVVVVGGDGRTSLAAAASKRHDAFLSTTEGTDPPTGVAFSRGGLWRGRYRLRVSPALRPRTPGHGAKNSSVLSDAPSFVESYSVAARNARRRDETGTSRLGTRERRHPLSNQTVGRAAFLVSGCNAKLTARGGSGISTRTPILGYSIGTRANGSLPWARLARFSTAMGPRQRARAPSSTCEITGEISRRAAASVGESQGWTREPPTMHRFAVAAAHLRGSRRPSRARKLVHLTIVNRP